MFGWFRSRPAACPVDELQRKWLDERWEWLLDEFGPRRLKTGPVVLPSPEFFPDPYDADYESAERMLRRVCEYMELQASRIELSFFDEQRSRRGAGAWAGAEGLYTERNGVYRIAVEVSTLADPLGLVATLAHELGHVHLLGHGRVTHDTEDHEPLTDLLTVYFGLGVITANAVVRETSQRDGNVYSWSGSKRGYLNMRDYGYALARFAHFRGEQHPAWANELRPDARAYFKQSVKYLDSRP